MGNIIAFVIMAAVVLAGPIYFTVRLIKRVWRKEPIGASAIEALVIFAILLILAAIAIPDFLKFQAKAKCSEHKTYLGAIFTAQVAYFGDHNTYAGGPHVFSILNWRPEGETTYAFYCGEDFIANTKGQPIHRTDVPAGVGSSDTGFTCGAVGNIDNDPALDYWTMNDLKQFKNEPTDL